MWARDEAIKQAEYSKKIGPAILTWFENYFDIPFPLPKQDMVAIPDFSAGAMENWGLITYRLVPPHSNNALLSSLIYLFSLGQKIIYNNSH